MRRRDAGQRGQCSGTRDAGQRGARGETIGGNLGGASARSAGGNRSIPKGRRASDQGPGRPFTGTDTLPRSLAHTKAGNGFGFGLPPPSGNNGGFCPFPVQNTRWLPWSRIVNGRQRYELQGYVERAVISPCVLDVCV